MTVSDYVIKFLSNVGIGDIFFVSGGGIMHLLDAVVRNKKINYVANRHEQASAIAAESYARIRNNISACLVTTGPGATNAITGVACAWFDSIPMMVISGQQKRELIADYSTIRNLGPQEVDIVSMVKPITKYATTIKQPKRIRYELEKALYYATSQRPGPVWLDIPLDVQDMQINSAQLLGFTHPRQGGKKKVQRAVTKTITLLKQSKRPVLILGNGIRLSGAVDMLDKFIKKVSIPILLPFNGLDLIAEDHPLLVGKFGPGGQRRGNFALQNADLILSIGASLNVSSIGFNYQNVAPRAMKIMVNIDNGELTKKTISVDFPIQADAKDFIEEFLCQVNTQTFTFSDAWMKACENWKKHYPTIIPAFFKDKKYVNSYIFFDVLSELLTKNDVMVTGIGLDAVSLYQGFKVKAGQRAYVNKNFGPMGWGLPASIGACFGNKRRRTILVTGDGSIQFNIQELGSIQYYRLPIKIFIFNNKGYESIRATQNNFFEGRFIGAEENSGVTNPDFKALAKTYNFTYAYIANNNKLKEKLNNILQTKGPVLCEVNISYLQARIPKSSSFRRADGTLESRPLEDMAPFLPREEIYKNMHLFDKEKNS